MTYLWARFLFRYNCYEALKLSVKFEFNRLVGSYFNVSVVYRLFLSSCTFLKNSLIRWVGHRLVILEGLYKSKLFFVPMWNLWSAVGFCVFNVHGDTLWLFLKTFRSIELQAGIIICRSDWYRLMRRLWFNLWILVFSTPTQILKLFAERVLNRWR